MIVLNPTTVPSASPKIPKVRMNRKGGISFNKACCEVLGIQPGNCIQFVFDEKSQTKDLYIEKVNTGFQLRLSHATRSRGLVMTSIGLYYSVRKLLEIETVDPFSIACAPELSEFEGKTVLALITRNIQM